MKNEINFYYKLKPIKVHQQQDKIIFYINNKKYILYKIEQDINVVEEKYRLHNYLMMIGKYCHKIVLNTSGNIITQIRNNQYVLIEINMKTRKIELEDVMNFMNIKINEGNFAKIKRAAWKKLWKRKVDYVELQYTKNKKQDYNLQGNIDFFVGVTENCISLINELDIFSTFHTINHERINIKTTTDEFYNPLEFIVDIRVRDIAEYIKRINELDNKIMLLKKLLIKKILDENEMVLLFIRILFPSDFFDQNDRIISENNEYISIKEKNNIKDNNFEDIKKIYLYLKDIINLPNIEWLEDIE